MEIIKIELKPSNISTIECGRNIKLGGNNAITVRDYTDGATPPRTEYGNLKTVKIPLKQTNSDCEMIIEVPLEPGCQPGTPCVVCDGILNPTEIAPNSSETIYILDGEPPYEWEIVGGHGYSLLWGTTEDVGGRPDERRNSWNTLYSSADSCGTAQVKITDNCQTEIICEFDSTIASDLEYDKVTSGETIGQSDSTMVAVAGGAPPYSWTITGDGFSLAYSETGGVTNTVHTTATACGAGSITITDVCGERVEGYIRCTSGYWAVVPGTPEDLADYVNGSGYCSGINWLELIDGKYKMRENITTVCQSLGGMPCPPDSCMHPWQLETSLYADKSMDCYTWTTTGCGNPSEAGIKDGLCCWHTGSNVRNRQGVHQRFVWEWKCL